jgi:6-phosphogluconolactonase (cycloisomerase 2 family)
MNILVKFLLTLVLVLPNLSQAKDATFFNVTSSGPPGNVNITLCLNAAGPMSCETFDVTGLTLSIITTTNHVYNGAGIKVNTPGYTVANLGIDCMPVGNNYCSFSVSKSSPKTITLNGGAKNPRFVYIGNWGNSAVTSCPVNADGSLSSCSFVYGCPSTVGCLAPDSLFSEPTSLVFNAAGTIAYINDYTNEEIYTCEVDSNGEFYNCAQITDPYSFVEPFAISLSPDGSIAYIGQYESGISLVKCNVNGLDLSGCVDTSYSNFDWPTNVVYIDNGTKAYVGNYDIEYIYLCDVNPTPGPQYGDLSGCTTEGGYNGDYYPTQIAINPAGTAIYNVWEYNSEVTLCSIHPTDNYSLSCSLTATSASYSEPYGIAINAAGTFAYISDYDLEQAFYCSINGSNGALENCTATGGSAIDGNFGYPMFINFLY